MQKIPFFISVRFISLLVGKGGIRSSCPRRYPTARENLLVEQHPPRVSPVLAPVPALAIKRRLPATEEAMPLSYIVVRL